MLCYVTLVNKPLDDCSHVDKSENEYFNVYKIDIPLAFAQVQSEIYANYLQSVGMFILKGKKKKNE